ncbi:MAG: hypothetical protein WBG42_00055 [Cryomorphaceae bacterium]
MKQHHILTAIVITMMFAVQLPLHAENCLSAHPRSDKKERIALKQLGVVIPQRTCPEALQQAVLLYEINRKQLQKLTPQRVRKIIQHRLDDFSTGC